MSSTHTHTHVLELELTSRNKLELEYALSPPLVNEPSPSKPKLAVLLHPWSWLGGNMDDPLLRIIEKPLRERGYHVLRYNSRGVGRSKGWPSLTGSQECEDLRDLIQWALSQPTLSDVEHLLLLGYSHGSLISTHHPPLHSPTLKTFHVLLSYPLSPLPYLTLFHSKSYASALSALVRNPAAHVLLVYGDKDEFTSVEKYNVWAERLLEQGKECAEGNEARVTAVCIQGATHFWVQNKAEEMWDAIARWLDARLQLGYIIS